MLLSSFPPYRGAMRIAPALALLACLAVTPARAQPNEVSPVTVMPKGPAPKLAASYPAAGQAVAPGVLVLSVTFDQPMSEEHFGFGVQAGAEALQCLATPRLLEGGRTFILLCRTRPGTTYAVALAGFASLSGARPEPAALTFTTTSGEPIRTLADAIRAAGLPPVDVPIQESPGMGPKPGQ